jgi:N utilization substance protein B
MLYRDDLNPQARVVHDALLEQGRVSKELQEFVSRVADAQDQDEDAAPDALMYRQWTRTPGLVQFTRSLVQGVLENRQVLDDRIGQAAEHWSVPRMAATDRNLLRLGAYEMLYTETPPKIAIDEAIELAKRFGGAQSAQFVNGILDKLMHSRDKQ